MQNNSKINTILPVIVIILLLVGIVMLASKKESGTNEQNTDNNSQIAPSGQTNSVNNQNNSVTDVGTPPPADYRPSAVPTGWSIASANGMSVSVPEGYSHNTQVPGALSGSGVALNIMYGNNIVANILKFDSQKMFSDSAPHGTNDYTLINSNYQISGISGQYYQRSSQSGGGNLIVVPSKLVIIGISPASFVGISQATLDQIVSSIKL